MSEQNVLAVEYALGLLEGEELLDARGRVASDPAFAAEVERWEAHFAPLLDNIGGRAVPNDVWPRIEAALAGSEADNGGATVVQLKQRLRRWKLATAGAGAAAVAASIALIATPTGPAPIEASAAAPLASSIPIGDTGLRLAVTYLPDREEMLVSASGLTADGVHDHELWLVPDEGALHSLGVVTPGEEVRVALDPATAREIRAGSQMLLTREPLGGKPANTDAGPVVAEGRFAAI